MQSLLLLLLLFACSASVRCSQQGFWNSQFSTSEFARFHYLNKYTVTIFQHITKNTTFYFTPLVLLDHNSGQVTHNVLTEFYELRLRVVMWDRRLKAAVSSHLTTKWSIKQPIVKAMPMEKVRFQWRSRRRGIKRSLQMEEEFISSHHLPSHLTLTFASKNLTAIRQLDARVRDSPHILDRLELECFMTSKKSAMKTVTVTIEHLMKSKTFAKLMSLPADGNYHYLRADDFNSLAHETFSSVKATTIRSTEYVDRSDEVNIISLIERALKQDEVLADSLTQRQWGSVFWDPAIARPDRVVHEANRSFSLDASNNQLRLNNRYVSSSETASSMFSSDSSSMSDRDSNWFGSAGFSRSASSSSGSSSLSKAFSDNKFNAEQINALLKGRGLAVEWTGERFRPKPVRLVRVNRRSFQSRRQIASESMQLTLYQQTISLKVRILQAGNESGVEASLGQQQVAAADVIGKFPESHSYCLLSNGGLCPPGFNRTGGYIKGISIDTENSANMMKAQLGDSGIRCHSPAGSNDCSFRAWEPFKAELHLYVCCR